MLPGLTCGIPAYITNKLTYTFHLICTTSVTEDLKHNII
jgi:hypothetical protein